MTKLQKYLRKFFFLCKDLKTINKEDTIDFISKNDYLKILISRIFYNYFALKTFAHYEDFYKVKMTGQFECFESIVHSFEIKNFLVDKIKADYSFINKEEFINEAKYKYAQINNNTNNISLSNLLRYAFSSNEKKLDKNKIDNASINALKELSFKLSEKFRLKVKIYKLIELLKK